jgi:hypothetical protein
VFDPFVTPIIEAKPQGLFSKVWGGDFVNWLKAKKMYVEGDKDMAIMSCGQCVGSICDIPAVRDLFERIMDQPRKRPTNSEAIEVEQRSHKALDNANEDDDEHAAEGTLVKPVFVLVLLLALAIGSF